MGTNYYLVKARPTIEQPLHIGKSSIGWRFLFYLPFNWETEGETVNSYPAWRDYIERRVEAGTHVILDEYDEVIGPEELFELIERKQDISNPDMFDDCLNIDGYRFTPDEFS